MKTLFLLLRHEMRLQARSLSEWASLLMFFVTVVILLPFALGPEPQILERLAPGLIWIAALLMVLMSLDRLFVADARDGTLDLMLTSPLPLEAVVATKILAQILSLLAALAALLPLGGLLFGLPLYALPVLILSFVLGAPVLVALGGIAGAITVALHKGPALLTLLLAPFFIPVLIFAVSACDAVLLGNSPGPALMFLAAIELLVIPSAPFIISAALRQGQG